MDFSKLVNNFLFIIPKALGIFYLTFARITLSADGPKVETSFKTKRQKLGKRKAGQ
jgi:hypothetical protein